MNIENFSASLIPAAAYSRHRDIAASDAENVRHDDEGALVVRNGYRVLPSDNEQIVAIFAHAGYVLGVTAAGELKWETEQNLLNASEGDSLFRSFIPARTGFDTQTRTSFISIDNTVFISNADVQLKIDFEDDASPRDNAFPFYIPQPAISGIHWGSGNIVYSYAPYADYSDIQRSLGNNFIGSFADEPDISESGKSYYNTTQQNAWYRSRRNRTDVYWERTDPPADWIGHFSSRSALEATGKTGVAFTGSDVEVASRNTGTDPVYLRAQLVKTLSQEGASYHDYPIESVGRTLLVAAKVPSDAVVDITLTSENILDTDADYIDLFQSDTLAEDADAEFYYITRIPYQVGTHRMSTLEDTDLASARELVEPIAEPAWTLAEASNDRLYLNTGKDNRIYMTYYDASERYFRTVRDYIPAKTGGFPITGLKLIRENDLTIYTSNRIFIMTIDPIPELHRIFQVFTSRDDKDASIGCIAPESLVDIDGYHYFLSTTRQIYQFDGNGIRWISEPINPILAKTPRTPAKNAVGFVRDLTYCLAYPSEPTSLENDALLLYDTQRRLWWKDRLRISGVSKGRSQAEFVIINALPAILDIGSLDNGERIEWLWKGNKVLIPPNTMIHSVFLGVIPEDVGEDPLGITIALRTEEGEQSEAIQVARANDYYDQIAGFNLRGRSVQVTLSGSGAMKIDRLMFNPQP